MKGRDRVCGVGTASTPRLAGLKSKRRLTSRRTSNADRTGSSNLTGLLPGDVDPSRRERHLSEDDFRATFGVGLSAFEAWPKWKQSAAKKKAGLY